ncbi:MAG: DNA repair protein RecO [Prolixibacteraceae bacterium]|jgi:DNA repair protein RecO (recombination protein O)|nr:DNA repair protein RecO [Prolixibacteraceae bacterium]
MIEKSRAIVLHHLKYSETSVIATLYTEAFGRQSYMINGIRSSKSKTKMGLLQPLFLLDVEAYHKPGREIQRLKEFRISQLYTSIPFDIFKSTMAMFMAEMMDKVLRSEETDNSLFDFIYHSFLFFDSIEKGAANFHLWFLIRMIGFLGYQFENNYSQTNVFFDLKAGNFVPQRPLYPATPNTEESEIIAQLIKMKAEEIQDFKMSGETRARILHLLLECYSIHFEGIGTINSLKVLQEIFH